VDGVVNAMGWVTVRLPDQTDGFGHIFHIGVNDLTGVTALDYAREQNLTEEGRVLRQQSLIRAVIRKLVHRHLLSNPVTDYRVLHALIGMLTVDSNFTTAELEQLAMQVRNMALNPVAGQLPVAALIRGYRQLAFRLPAQCR
jgi:anionic cell wall polymer biosynthesis LytR-Cps2A-Psr (LCP) family protein